MTRYTRVRLAPLGPFHFGGRGVGLEHTDIGLPADTLFSALCVTIAEHEGSAALEALLARFTGEQPPFRLTSLMPYAGQVYFLPPPLIGPPDTEVARDLKRRKTFKEIAWVSESVFRVLVRGEAVPDAMLEHEKRDGKPVATGPVAIHGGKVWLTADERTALGVFEARDLETNEEQKAVLWRTATRPHVAVDRVTSASNVFASGATHFNRTANDAAGLYTMIEWLDADEALRRQIATGLERLGQSGIGGERSSGYGQFTVQLDALDQWPIGAAQGSCFVTLAPYHPRWRERAAFEPPAHYEIVLRRGWLSLPGYTSIRRGTIRMVAAGSVLAWPQGVTRTALGDVVDATPQRLLAETGRRIYRYGLAFPVTVADAAVQRKEDRL